ncbi:MAG: insulinase family protein [Candidatus Omnitrophica bacterium]|nr:insulinase family protein [Candidatus Omnitrophota bacterium]
MLNENKRDGEFNYHLSELKNGLRVVTCPAPGRDSVALAVWVKVGGRFESKKITGVSHFIEHILFKGTKNRTTRQIKEEIEGVGGMLNAFTSEECTCYMARVLNKDWESALDVLADMINDAILTSNDIEKERTVILEEIKMYFDLPMHFVHEMLMDLLWPNQSLGNYIAGTLDSVNGLGPSTIRDFKRQYYNPRNILVTVFGDVHPNTVLEQIEEHFGRKPGGRASTFRPARSRLRNVRTCFEDKKTEQTHFVMGVHCGSRNNPDRYKTALLNVILGGNMSSRLFEQVREQRGLAYSIRSHISAYEDTGAFTISAGVDDRKTFQTICVIMRELDKLATKRVPEAELRRAKDYFSGQLILGLEDILEHMLWVGERYLFTHQVPDRKKIEQEIEAVSAEDIRGIARKLFRDQHFAVSLIGPTKEKVLSKIKKEIS